MIRPLESPDVVYNSLSSFAAKVLSVLQGISNLLKSSILLPEAKRGVAAAIALVGLVATTSTATAQVPEDLSAPVKVIHRPFNTSSLPAIGTPMSLEIELLNTFDIESKIRLIGAKDGRFIDIAFPRGALNAADRPTFRIEVPSPVAAMTYQFVVHQKDGSLSSSERFTIKRNCIQNFKVTVPEDTPNSEFRREVSTLVAQAKSLERDTASLEASLKLLEDIKASLTN